MDQSIILHPTDFSTHSEQARRFASSVAARMQAKLLVVHVIQPAELEPTVAEGTIPSYPLVPTNTASAESPLAERAKESLFAITADEGVELEHQLLEGDPATEIVALADKVGASQIVMGSHGRRGISRVLIGSVAESVLRRAHCPVTVVKTLEDDTGKNR